jgi:hypothetical protein
MPGPTAEQSEPAAGRTDPLPADDPHQSLAHVIVDLADSQAIYHRPSAPGDQYLVKNARLSLPSGQDVTCYGTKYRLTRQDPRQADSREVTNRPHRAPLPSSSRLTLQNGR